MELFAFLLVASISALACAKSYHVSESYVGNDFYRGFDFQAITDPTHGRVNYVDMYTAQGRNLTYTTGDTFILRGDSWSYLRPNGPGRDSVRIQSKKTYTDHISVFNVRHMPQGCGTWPAMWYADVNNWPGAGEIDVVEGVNDISPNAATLHSTAGCTMPGGRNMQGSPTQPDCNVNVNGNAGCGVRMSTPLSYGPSFNANGGGWFVTERTSAAISVWFWARNDPSVPAAVRDRRNDIVSGDLGTPQAYFPNTNCNFGSHFGALRIIINLTFCGDWAGSVYNSDSCPGSCIDRVNNNPSSFGEAYFNIANIDIYV
ncbi:glycoside hydrolase family 16 protein [Schizophyllum commune]